MLSVYITGKIPETGKKLLLAKGYRVDANNSEKPLTNNELKEVFSKYDAICTMIYDKIDEEIIKSAGKNLKIIANFAVGFDNIDVIFAKKRGIVVANTPGIASRSVAEHTMMLILACQKRLIEADRYVRSGKFEKWDPELFLSAQVSEKMIGIVGLGGIGMAVGLMAHHGFKMKIFYNDVVRSEDFEILTGAKIVGMETLLSNSDIVTLHVPLNNKTHHLIDEPELSVMKKTAILINTSRGKVLNQTALVWALTHGIIAGAGLDVYEHEPRVEHELTKLPNVVLTPHIASATIETREATAKVTADNIIDVFEGRTPFGLIKVD